MGLRTESIEQAPLLDEQKLEVSLRPKQLVDYVGQRAVVDKLKVYTQAAKQRREALDHCLFSGPPGLGKTSLAHIIAAEMGVGIYVTSGPALEKRGDLAGLLTSLEAGDILFVDEIHRLSPAVEEYLYPAMEDYRLDITIDSGPSARAMKLELPRFTLVAATTRVGLISAPLRDRFPIQERLEYYDLAELRQIVLRSARLLSIAVDDAAADAIAKRARGTPRIANRLLRRVRDFAEVDGLPAVHSALANRAMDRLGLDVGGLDAMDRRYLEALCRTFAGGPVGVDTLAAALSEESDTIQDVVEPYLMQQGLVARTPRGRVATAEGARLFGAGLPGRE